jgi:hypothetical protein
MPAPAGQQCSNCFFSVLNGPPFDGLRRCCQSHPVARTAPSDNFRVVDDIEWCGAYQSYPPPTGQSCANCYFSFTGSDGLTRCCFENPPPGEAAMSKWPVIDPAEWCGDWSADGTPRAPGLIQINYYFNSQTILIPLRATKADVLLVGGGGGVTGSASQQVTGGGAYLTKYLSGIIPGNTLSLTIGAGGTNGVAAGKGGDTILQSGTQTIQKLTAGGGNGGNTGVVLGGVASGGDFNLNGGNGQVSGLEDGTDFICLSGGNPLGPASGCGGADGQTPGRLYGGGAVQGTGASGPADGGAGVARIAWYS